LLEGSSFWVWQAATWGVVKAQAGISTSRSDEAQLPPKACSKAE
jgi:hypothetical protein